MNDMRLIAIEYPERRLEFFKEQLAAANRRLDWSMKHNPDCYDHAEKGEVVSFYQWAVQMAEGKHEFIWDEQRGEAVCRNCGYVATADNKKAALEYGMAMLRAGGR